MISHRCECSDPGCPKCQGHCHKLAVTRLCRVDMEDTDGTWFCDSCGDDAIGAGVFTTKETN